MGTCSSGLLTEPKPKLLASQPPCHKAESHSMAAPRPYRHLALCNPKIQAAHPAADSKAGFRKSFTFTFPTAHLDCYVSAYCFEEQAFSPGLDWAQFNKMGICWSTPIPEHCPVCRVMGCLPKKLNIPRGCVILNAVMDYFFYVGCGRRGRETCIQSYLQFPPLFSVQPRQHGRPVVSNLQDAVLCLHNAGTIMK